MECDNKMYALWLARQKTFPGKSVNTFHGMFCSIRNFVHAYEMDRRGSEESNESFNVVLASSKRLLVYMRGRSRAFHVSAGMADQAGLHSLG